MPHIADRSALYLPTPNSNAKPALTFVEVQSHCLDGLVAVGGELDTATVMWAYRNGIFPWPVNGLPLLWYSPPQRAILEFPNLHIPRRLARRYRSTELRFTVDAAFLDVLEQCRRVVRPDQDDTWITPAMSAAFQRLHGEGIAHSVEAWDSDGELVGGLYGLDAGGLFCGESMFHVRPDASKLALLHLIEHLGARGATWLDIQVMTPHLEALGATTLEHPAFLARLGSALDSGLNLFAPID